MNSLSSNDPYWKHKTSDIMLKQVEGVDLFDDEEEGFVSIYERFTDGSRWPARTVNMAEKEQAEDVIAAWGEKGEVRDYRGK